MAGLILFDIAPDPGGIAALLVIVLLVLGFIVLLAVGVVLFLWYRKRSMRGAVMIRPDALPLAGADLVQPSSPSQP